MGILFCTCFKQNGFNKKYIEKIGLFSDVELVRHFQINKSRKDFCIF